MRRNLQQTTIGAPLFIFAVILLGTIGYFIGIAPAVIMKSAGLLIITALGILVINLSAAHHVQPEIQHILAGNYWAHWHYPFAIWEQEWPTAWFGVPIRMHKQSVMSLVQMAVVAALLLGGLGYILGLMGGTPTQALQVALISGLLLGISFAVGLYDDYRQIKDQPAPKVVDLFVGVRGLHTPYLPERFLRVAGPGFSLASVLVIAGQPARLQFTIRISSNPRQTYTAFVPIPAGHEAEAEQLADRFRETYDVSHSATGQTPT